MNDQRRRRWPHHRISTHLPDCIVQVMLLCHFLLVPASLTHGHCVSCVNDVAWIRAKICRPPVCILASSDACSKMFPPTSGKGGIRMFPPTSGKGGIRMFPPTNGKGGIKMFPPTSGKGGIRIFQQLFLFEDAAAGSLFSMTSSKCGAVAALDIEL
jgi:hypothetical protein